MITRRRLLGAAAATPFLSMPAVSKAASIKTLRYVPSSNLTVLDPVFTPASVSVTHGYCVFDTLYGVDAKLDPKPQMAAGHTVSDNGLEWRISLRDGLKFHDGEPVRAQDCAASLARWSKRDSFGQALGAAVESWGVADDKTVRIKLTRPFGQLLHAIGKPHSSPAMIMPERLAKTDASKQITEMVGSGPYRFKADEYVSGDRVVYERFKDYAPRTEAAAWTSGGKVAHFDRLEWRIIPDAATAVSAIQAGEVDWVSTVLSDLQPVIAAQQDVKLFRTDPYGVMSVMRFNFLNPPFNNVKLRQVILKAVNQTPFLQGLTSNEADRRACFAMYPCGMPGVDEIGKGIMGSLDIAQAKKEIAEAGYKGERIVIINPTDIASIHPLGVLTADLLKKLGMNVDLQEMDWGTVVQRRVSKEPVEKGGWSIAVTNWPSIAIANPATNATTRGLGKTGWWGWFSDPTTEDLVKQWLGATDEAEAKKLFTAVHKRALEEVPIVPLGITFGSGAMRANLTGALHGSVDMFWNIQRT